MMESVSYKVIVLLTQDCPPELRLFFSRSKPRGSESRL
ncbi:uncharacterized protein METZ01_LOCUS359595, partial [marine metagenome]